MDKFEIYYRIKKVESILADYTTLDNDIKIMCCLEEMLKILKGLIGG